jgi:hypothetical protein
MMTMIRTLLTAAILAGSIGAAEAQTPPAAPMAPMQGGMPMGGEMGRMMQNMMPMMGMMAPQRVEGRIAFLKTELKITDAQLPEWNAYADLLRKNAKAMSDAGGMMSQMAAPMSAPDRADQRVKTLTARLETSKTNAIAIRALYAVLSDAQKKTADELLAPPMGRM